MTHVLALLAERAYAQRLFSLFVSGFCFLFGVFLLVYVVSPADGYWTLHAELMRQGSRLYSDLGVNQQPLYFILSMWSLGIAPNTILGQRILPGLVLLCYVYLTYRTSRLARLHPMESGLLQLAVFFTAIHPVFFRFDDYHAVTHVWVLTSVFLSARYISGAEPLRRYVLLQVTLATLIFLTRINDALAIAASVGLIVVLKQRFSRELMLVGTGALLLSASIIAVALLVLGETPTAWVNSTLLEASTAKGGEGIWRYPFRLLMNSAAYVATPTLAPLPLLLLPAVAGLALAWRKRSEPRVSNALVAITGLYLIFVLRWGYQSDIFYSLTPWVLLGMIALVLGRALHTATRKVQRADPQSGIWALGLYPIFLFIFGSLSSGGGFGGLEFPLAVTLLLVPLVALSSLSPPFKTGARFAFAALCLLLAAYAVKARFNNPWSWWSYRVSAPAPNVSIRQDDRLGTHFITSELASFIDPVCAKLDTSKTMWSTPFSFANYYCGVPAWRGYLQTWYDLSTAPKITRLLADLRRSPPDYVLYQKLEGALRFHETLFHRGQPLPYRKLEAYIGERVSRGEWQVIHESRAFPDSHWFLLRTDRSGRHLPEERASPRSNHRRLDRMRAGAASG
jgi:hypothetical protein